MTCPLQECRHGALLPFSGRLLYSMIMMSRFVQRIINSPPMCYQTAEQRANVDGESYKSQGGWLTVSDDWTCDHKTPRPERGPCSWY